jgi:hypothetical protein
MLLSFIILIWTINPVKKSAYEKKISEIEERLDRLSER